MDEKPNYYAIIPAEVRYDNELTANAKLLYAEITSLANKTGSCWATNEYFAYLYKTSTKTITRTIKKLSEKNYIKTTVETKRFEDGTIKKIRIIHMDKNVLNHMDKNVLNHMDKNVPYNNTRTINNIESRENKFSKPTLDEIKEFIVTNNYNVDHDRFFNYYESNGWMIGKNKMKNWKATIRNWQGKEKKVDYGLREL